MKQPNDFSSPSPAARRWPPLRRGLLALLLLGLAPWLAGCFDIEQGVKLNKDLSGTATFNFVIDMEPAVVMMASMEKAFSGDESPLTEEEIEAQRQEFLSQQESEEDPPFDRETVEEDLPEGVELVSFEPVEEGLRFGARIELAFDHVSKLSQISFEEQEGEGEEEAPSLGPEQPDVLERPFEALKFIDEGETMLVTSPAVNPLDETREESPSAEEAGEREEAMKKAFDSLRIVYRLTLPFEILEHNAMRTEGDTLWWEYDFETFERMTEEQLAGGIRVRFKK